MAKRFALIGLLAFACCAVVAPGAGAKDLTAAVQGATVPGLPYRYLAIGPNSPYRVDSMDKTAKFTVVGRIDKQGGRLGRWWYLPGRYSIPAAAYDDTAGGLSADGSTLVLSRFSWIYRPRTTGLAIIHTKRRVYTRGKGRSRRVIDRVIDKLSFPGGFSFDAISPDGSTVYLIQHLSPVFGGAYQVRALDTKRGRLLPEPIVDPEEPGERMEGVAVSRAAGRDGRWAYTLYSGQQGRDGRGHEPFIHALDTVAGRAVCIDLPQLEGRRNPFLMALRAERKGQELTVLNRRPGLEGSRPLLSVDTSTFKVHEPTSATASSSGAPWLPIGVLGACALALVAWMGLRRRRDDASRESRAEQA